MNALKEYRLKHSLTQVELVEELKGVADLNAPLISAIESGKVEMTDALKAYIGASEADADLTQTESLVLEACKRASSENPVTRSDLKDITSLTDRKARLVIEGLRDKGYRIVSNLNGIRGYWYGTPAEYRAWIRQYQSYADTIYRRKAAMDRRTEGQIEWRIEKAEGTSD